MNQQLICSKHRNPLAFVCTVQPCTNRRMCEECKTKQNLHFTQHANYIYRLKDFYDYSSSQELIPRLQKGIQDSQNFINAHKAFYRQQIQSLGADFQLLAQQFKEVTQSYSKIYIQAFQKEMNIFDQELMSIKSLLNEYLYQKSQQESFFSRLFSNDDKQNKQVEELVKKHSKVFKVRAAIIALRTKITTAKANKTTYKATNQQQIKLDDLKEHLRTFTANLYDKLKELLANQGSSTALKSSILSQSRALSNSQVNMKNQFATSQISNASSNSFMSSRSYATERVNPQPQRVKSLPQLHPNVLKWIKHMRSIQYPPGLQMIPGFGKRDEGPFRYSLGTYYGSYQNGVRCGKGIFIFSKDGSYYEGTWQDDNMWGYGRLVTPNSYYEGEISGGLAHGNGTFENLIKVYSGEWKNDKRNGRGQQSFKQTRSCYKGDFLNDKYHGKGTLQEVEYIYSGDFKEGLFDGDGIMRYKNGETFAGKFRAGQRVLGRHTMPDGSFYDGPYDNGLPNGKGQFRWCDGVRYIGGWVNGLQQGEGLYSVDGSKQTRGLWKGGSWLRWL